MACIKPALTRMLTVFVSIGLLSPLSRHCHFSLILIWLLNQDNMQAF